MKEMQVENIIIGFGKAGKTLAADLAKAGQSVVLIEQDEQMYGGTCINVGCIPSKKMITLAKKGVDFNQAMAIKDDLIGKLRQANFNMLDQLDNVTILLGKGQFLDQNTIQVTGKDDITKVTGKNIFINTGAVSRKLTIKGSDSAKLLDSSGLLSLNKLPQKLLIVGGSYIGLEFAFMYQAFGSKVEIIELGDVFMPREDRDVADEMLAILKKRGIEVHLGVNISQFIEQEDKLIAQTDKGEFSADVALSAIGRVANLAELALDKAGVAITKQGTIAVDDKLRAKDNIWAMGDVAGSAQFTFVSLDDYRIVRSQILGGDYQSVANRRLFATTLFSNPPLARVGLTEYQAKEKGLDFVVKKLPAQAIPQAKILEQTDGFLKVLVDKGSDKVLGAALFCVDSHELINLITLAIEAGVTANQLKTMIYTHPTIAESFNNLFA